MHRYSALAAVGDPTRRAILERLAERPRPVGELALDLPVGRRRYRSTSRSSRTAGLVVDEAVGTRQIYRRAPDGIHLLHAELDRFWTKSLADFKRAAEHSYKERQ